MPESVNESGVELYLEGIIELPMAVGTKGGALPTHPGYRYTHALLGNPTARELSELMVAVGLAQVSRICYHRMNHRIDEYEWMSREVGRSVFMDALRPPINYELGVALEYVSCI